MNDTVQRTIVSSEPAETPPMGLFFAYIAMAPLVLGTIVLWFGDDARSFLALNLTLFWGASILMFLAGVHRGVSFRTPGGPKATQVAMMLWLFIAGFVGLFATTWAYPMTATVLEIAGFASLAVLDPIAARNGDAPLFFARLRPVQMAIPLLMLVAVAIFIYRSPFL